MKEMWDAWEKAWGAVTCLECRAKMKEPKHLKFHPMFVAHIVSKGSMPAARKDVRNVIPVCLRHHKQMDDGLGHLTRKDMEIWPYLEEITNEIKNDYQ